jgi:hypothetical protein
MLKAFNMNRQHAGILKFSDPPFNRYDFLHCRPYDVKTILPLAPDRSLIHLRSGAVSYLWKKGFEMILKSVKMLCFLTKLADGWSLSFKKVQTTLKHICT